MDFLIVKEANEEGFRKITQKLFDQYVINTHSGLYRLTEVEFYWNSKSHSDKTTYEPKHYERKRGDWFFHYSGVDIALKNDDDGFGGILIRTIMDVDTGIYYRGPQVCMMRLFSGANAFSPSFRAEIIPHNFEKSTILSQPRIGLGKNAVESGTDKYNYNFGIKVK